VRQDAQLAKRYKTSWRNQGLGKRKIEKDLQGNPIKDMPAISGDTVYRRLKEQAGSLRVVPKKFVLTEDHKKKRRKWAREMKNETFDEWMFSDETMFKVGDRKRSTFQFPGETVEDIRYQFPVRQNVWACMSTSGVGEMAFIDGNLTGEQFKDILEHKLAPAVAALFPDGSFKFQMDNDPKHKAEVVSSWLAKEGVQVVNWPPSSPDMNPMENLHKIWKDRVYALRPSSNQDLRNKIETVFRAITKDDTQPLVDSMPRRVRALAAAKGGHTKY
jgi:hypothetical protein